MKFLVHVNSVVRRVVDLVTIQNEAAAGELADQHSHPVQCPRCKFHIGVKEVLSSLRPGGFTRAYRVKYRGDEFILRELQVNPAEVEIEAF